MRRLASAMRGRRLAIAESCTGGLVADRITDVPGASEYLGLCVVAYSNESKVRLLGVDGRDLERYGAVSDRVAASMAEGVRRLVDADVGASTSGIAGPGGATATKPVGLVHFAVSTDAGTVTDHRVFPGDRREVKIAATEHLIGMVIDAVSDIRGHRDEN